MPSSRPVCLACGGRLLYVERVVRTFEVDRVERGCVERGDLVETNEGSPTALHTGRLVCEDCERSWPRRPMWSSVRNIVSTTGVVST